MYWIRSFFLTSRISLDVILLRVSTYWLLQSFGERNIHIVAILVTFFVYSGWLHRLETAYPPILMVFTFSLGRESSLQYEDAHVLFRVVIFGVMKVLCKSTVSWSFSAIVSVFRHSCLQCLPCLADIK